MNKKRILREKFCAICLTLEINKTDTWQGNVLTTRQQIKLTKETGTCKLMNPRKQVNKQNWINGRRLKLHKTLTSDKGSFLFFYYLHIEILRMKNSPVKIVQSTFFAKKDLCLRPTKKSRVNLILASVWA